MQQRVRVLKILDDGRAYVIYDRRVSARKESVYTIIGYWEDPHAERKGDN